jgi:hypothetical protein
MLRVRLVMLRAYWVTLSSPGDANTALQALLAAGDATHAARLLRATLQITPHHVPTHLLLAKACLCVPKHH